MVSASMEMSGSAQSHADTPRSEIDTALGVLHEHAREFARMSPLEKAALLRECVQRVVDIAPEWADAACKAKGLSMDAPSSAEEWLGGPMTTVRNMRLLISSLEDIAATGKPKLAPKNFSYAHDGRLQVDVFPTSGLDAAMFSGFNAKVRFLPAIDEQAAREQQASFFSKKDPQGGVSLILGAGNVASIPPMDAFYKMFVEGLVCMVKMNPVNEYLGPIFERAFRPMIERGFLRISYGGADVGSYLCYHDAVHDVHITGSDRTHDLIVWGAPGAERARRMEANDPLLKKTITSELGCVTPVVIAPAVFSEKELQFVAENVATMVANNGSFNCNAAKMLVTSKGWAQREDFLRRVRAVLAGAPLRKAYYPGAHSRYETLLKGHSEAEMLGNPAQDQLAWALVWGLDSSSKSEPLFTTEPFCAILSETALPESDPEKFLEAATKFCNETLWGTLSAIMIIHPSLEKDRAVAGAVNKAVAEMNYGGIAINQWAGMIYGTVSPPWGAAPGATLKDVQSGIGWVHNTFMLEGISKTVLRGPLTIAPKPPWFITHANSHRVAQRLVSFEAYPSWLKVPGIVVQALRG